MSLLIRGGTVVTAEGTARADVYCADGVIKAVRHPAGRMVARTDARLRAPVTQSCKSR